MHINAASLNSGGYSYSLSDSSLICVHLSCVYRKSGVFAPTFDYSREPMWSMSLSVSLSVSTVDGVRGEKVGSFDESGPRR